MNCTGVRAPNLDFTSATLSIVVCYLLVFLLALVGNSAMFLILFRNQCIKRRRVHSLLLHMTVAHLLVTLIYMPKEIIHQVTVAWWGGDLLCRICKFFDVFGVALSAGILMCLSLDRFYSILFPLYVINAKKSVTRMLTVAWTISLISSLPQIYIFRTARHPCFQWYTQCVSADVIGMVSPKLTFWFSVLNILQVYFIPLLVILICYGSILISISLKTRTTKNDGSCYSWNKNVPSNDKKKSTTGKNSLAPNKLVVNNYSCSVVKKSNGTVCDSTLRRTGGGDSFQRAKNRTLKMTIVLVLAFLLCWTPYTVAMFIHFLHASSSHRPIPPLLSKFLYAFAVFNSALSPYLYGYFSFNIREELKLLLYCCSKPACFTSTGSGSPHSSQSAISIRDRRRFAVRQKTPELSSISSTMANTHIMPNNSKEPYKSSGNSMSLPKSRFIQQQQRISSISLKHHNYVAKTSSHQSAGQRAKNLSFQLDAPRDYQPSPLSICEPEACLNGSTGKINLVGEQAVEVNGSQSSAARCSLTDEESCLLRTTGEPAGCTQSQSLLLLTDDDGDNYSNTSSNAGARSQSFIAVNNNNNNMDEEEEEQDFNGDGSSGATESTAKQPLLLSPKVGTYRNAKWKHTNKLKDTEKQTIEKEELNLN